MHHSTISQNVVEYLRNRIIAGDLTAGHRLKEKELANILNVSTAPVREAFQVLENEHLISKNHRRGCVVSEFSLLDCRQIFKARETLECCAINQIKEQGITELPDVVSALNSSVNVPSSSFEDEQKLMREHNPFPEFHIKLVASSRNTWLASLYHTLCPTLARYQFMSYVPGHLKGNVACHREILSLIQKGSYDMAQEVLKTHLSLLRQQIEERIKMDGRI